MSSVFSARLTALRKEHNMTQSDLAKVLHKTRSTVSGYETEGKEPDYDLLCSIAQYFGVSTDYLLGISDNLTPNNVVFINDTNNFKQNYDKLSQISRQNIAQIYDSFYLLLSRDTKENDINYLEIYNELFNLMQFSRAEIHQLLSNSEDQINNPHFFSRLMVLQNDLKNNVSILLDKLMQVDIDTAFEIKNDDE